MKKVNEKPLFILYSVERALAMGSRNIRKSSNVPMLITVPMPVGKLRIPELSPSQRA